MEDPLDFLQDSLSPEITVPTFPFSPLSTSSTLFEISSSKTSPIDAALDYFKGPCEVTVVSRPPLSKHACVACYRSKKPCDRNRPCQRCISRKIPHLCAERPIPQKRKDVSKNLPTDIKLEPREEKRMTAGVLHRQPQDIKIKTPDESEPCRWSEVWARTLKVYVEQVTYSPYWERKRIVFLSILAEKGRTDCFHESLLNLLEQIIEKKPSHFQQPLQAIKPKSPLPLRYGLIPDEKIGENYQPAVVFQSSIVHDEEDYVYFEFGVNTEAERLFGYSRHELFSLYRARHKAPLERLIASTQWARIINNEIKALASGNSGFRLFATCINKWGCPIRVLFDARLSHTSTHPSLDRTCLFFVPLPLQLEKEIALLLTQT